MQAHAGLRARMRHQGPTCAVDDGGCWEGAFAVCQAVDQTLCNRFLSAAWACDLEGAQQRFPFLDCD